MTFFACKEEQNDMQYPPEIHSPREGDFFFTGEAVRVEAEAKPMAGYAYMEVYTDGTFLFETDHLTIDTMLRNQELNAGTHVIKVRSIDIYGSVSETSVAFKVTASLEEVNDEVTFSEGQLTSWFLSNWSLDLSKGFDDSYSLLSSSDNATAIVRKQFDEAGSISFYVKNGAENLEFKVDGAEKSSWFGKDDWAFYAYSIPEGDHVFKWVSTAAGSSIDKIEFNPGLEQHSPGEIYGGGTIFYLDSTGRHGLIAASKDGMYNSNYEIPWGCYGLTITTGTRALSKTDGEGNTLAIITDCTLEHIAARYCHDFITINDLIYRDDWYLPAIDELDLLHTNRDKVDNLKGQYYWSSTSNATNAASVINFKDGRHHGANRNIPNINGPSVVGIYVRPVRKF